MSPFLFVILAFSAFRVHLFVGGGVGSQPSRAISNKGNNNNNNNVNKRPETQTPHTHTHTHIIQSIGFVVVHPKILNKLLETSAVFERLLHFLAPLSCFKRSPFFQFPSLAQTHNAHRHTYTSYNIHHAIIHHVCMALCMHASVRAHTQTERKTYEHIRNTQRNDPHRKAFVQTLSIPWYGYGYVPPPVLATEQWTERFNWFAQPSTDLSSSHFLWHTGNDIYIYI